MNHPRYSFGYCTLDFGRYIVAVGGALDNHLHTDFCEFYDVTKDKWNMLPRLNEKKYSPSVVSIKDEYLYSFGGAILH